MPPKPLCFSSSSEESRMLLLEGEEFVFHRAGHGKFEATLEIFGLTSRRLD